MTDKERNKLKQLLIDIIPADGKSIGNVTLLSEFKNLASKAIGSPVSDDDYWEIRNSLIFEGILAKGRGKGGSVYRVDAAIPTPTVKKKKGAKSKKLKESQLYAPFEKYLTSTWVKDTGLKSYVIETTASQGKRKTGGKWSRPDLAIVAVRSYPFVPGKVLDLITFEVKPEGGHQIESVFETAAHSRFSNKSYLAIFTPDGRPDTEQFERVEKECDRFNVGLIIFTDPNDTASYEVIQEPDRRTPDPEDVNGFISSQINKDNQTRLLEMLK